ncbi:Hypp4785 [Branchiostoma lanceolatum]|uniref:Hypp4785 protein n=1 Tax=Branchiostoma lanceolatum TaxID=7740 RepID=A0A8K0EX71_BRALA|nr:Hypp4785 [Branchiostoma lanceolatum]
MPRDGATTGEVPRDGATTEDEVPREGAMVGSDLPTDVVRTGLTVLRGGVTRAVDNVMTTGPNDGVAPADRPEVPGSAKTGVEVLKGCAVGDGSM